MSRLKPQHSLCCLQPLGLILPDEWSIFTFPGDFLKSVQTQQSDWKIKRSFAQVRMFMSRDKIFNYFASFQHISKTGWIQLIKHQQLNIVLLRQRTTPSAGYCLHFNHSRHDTAVAPALHCRQPSGRTNSKLGLQMLSTPFGKPIWPAITFKGLPYPEDFSLAGRVPHTQTWGNYQWVGLSRCV